MGGEQLGDAAAVRGRVDVQHPGAPQRLGERADAFERLRLDDVAVVVEVLVEQRHTFEQLSLLGRQRTADSGQSIRRVPDSIDPNRARAVACPDKFRGTLRADEARGGDGGRRPARRVSTRSSSCRSPTAAKARSTRCSRRAAARGASTRVTGPLGDPVDARVGRAARRHRGRSRWRGRAGSRWSSGRNDPLRASTRGTGELIAAVRARGLQPRHRRGRRQRDDRRRARRGRSTGLVVARHRRSPSRATSRRRSSTRRASTDRRRARARRRSRCSRAGSRRSPTSTGTRTGVDVDAVDRRGRGRWSRRWSRRDRRASSCPASTSSPKRSGLEAAFEGADLAVTGEGQARRVEPRGQGRGRGARVGRRPRRRRTSR